MVVQSVERSSPDRTLIFVGDEDYGFDPMALFTGTKFALSERTVWV